MRSMLINVICECSPTFEGNGYGKIIQNGLQWKSRARESLQLLLNEGVASHFANLSGTPGVTALAPAAYNA